MAAPILNQIIQELQRRLHELHDLNPIQWVIFNNNYNNIMQNLQNAQNNSEINESYRDLRALLQLLVQELIDELENSFIDIDPRRLNRNIRKDQNKDFYRGTGNSNSIELAIRYPGIVPMLFAILGYYVPKNSLAYNSVLYDLPLNQVPENIICDIATLLRNKGYDLNDLLNYGGNAPETVTLTRKLLDKYLSTGSYLDATSTI